MKNLDVYLLCLRPNTSFPLFSWIIRIVQKTKYSHQAIQVGDTIFDATIHGVNSFGISEYRKKYQLIKKIKLKHDLRMEGDVYSWIWKYRHVKYSIAQNIGLGLRYLKVIKSNPFGSDSHQIVCSELAILFMDMFCSIDIEDSDNYDLVRVEEIAEGIKCL